MKTYIRPPQSSIPIHYMVEEKDFTTKSTAIRKIKSLLVSKKKRSVLLWKKDARGYGVIEQWELVNNVPSKVRMD
jgi:hypothetical protein